MKALLTFHVLVAVTGVVSAQVTTEQQPLPAASGWNAARIHSGDGGVWYARVAKVWEAYGAPELIVTDDKGHLTVLSVYSGKWTARAVRPDGGWLAPSLPADVDARIEGRELYAAGKHGNIHRITVRSKAFGNWGLDSAEIGHASGEEFHTVVAADLDPSTPRSELLAFAISGAVYRLQPDQQHDSAFTMEKVDTIEGRVRDAVVLPGTNGAAPWIAAVSRSGHLLAMRLRASGLERRVLMREPMGLGRIAYRRETKGQRRLILYVTRDDGVVLRLLRRAEKGDAAEAARGNGTPLAPLASSWSREVILAGAQGLRGVVAGRFHADPSQESVMVYGYGKKLQCVSRRPGGRWEVETVFVGEHRGHWLCVGEFDGRNATDEVIATGFGGQVVLVSRPPGHGLDGAVAVDREPESEAGTNRPWRIAVKASEEALRELSPLNYQGGFETKTMVYETLVRRDREGRIVPGLAAAWELAADGCSFTFTLREGATFHDNTPVTAADVAVHFKRWVGLPEHAWLRCNERITAVQALGPRRLRITLDRPYALLADLCAINPTAIRGPGALNREGAHRRPVGSGPFAFVESREQGRVLRYRRHRPDRPDTPLQYVDLVRLEKTPGDDPLDALLRGEVDGVLGSWLVQVDPARVSGFREDPRFRVLTAPGSSMTYVGFRLERGPTASRELRRHIAAAIDRKELVRVVEYGLADPATGWAAPSVRIWPQGRPSAQAAMQPAAQSAAQSAAQPAVTPAAAQQPLRILPGRRGSTLLAKTLAAQLRRAGLPAVVVTRGHKDPDWDLRIEVTHGVPYDPYTTAVSRFTPPSNRRNAESPRFSGVDPRVTNLMRKAMATPDDAARYTVYAEIQELLDAEAVIVPLYARRRIAILRRGMPVPKMDHDMYTLDASWLTDAR